SLLRPGHRRHFHPAPPHAWAGASLSHLGISFRTGHFCYSVSDGAGQSMVGLSVGTRAGRQRYSRILSLDDMETFKVIDETRAHTFFGDMDTRRVIPRLR